MKKYQSYIDELTIHLSKSDESRFVAQQLLRMHRETSLKDNPLIVELGVDRGQSTKIFINSIDEKKNAKLISVDIKDCKDAVNDENWEFVQQDSADIQKLLSNKPQIKKGIDILYIDSLHTATHVKKEFYNFYEYLNKNAYIFFDDIDSNPYMANQRKDSINTEIANREILKLLEAIFRANMDKIDFEIMRGSTGLGIFKKLNNLGEKLNPPNYIEERNNLIINKIFQKILLKKSYQHDDKSDKSFIIKPNKIKK
tara:strand:- start:16798 stop:17562 length:765 start_codon:yes stop_codon:yes gene_type:complete